jgi:hypothetical protein
MPLLKLLPLTAAATCALATAAGAADAAPRPLVVPSAVRVVEGAQVRVAVKLPKTARARTSVRWSIPAGRDVVRTRGVVRIARGRRAGALRLVTRQDALREGDERFTLRVGRRSVRVTIADDDRVPVGSPAGAGAGTPAPPAPQPPQPQPQPPAPQPPVLPVAPPPPPAPALPVVSVGDLSRGESAADTTQPALALSRPSTEDVVVSWAY